MTFKKCISIIFISIMFYSLSGCDSKNILLSNNSENNKKIEITINPEISEYSPFMSSTPGIPLTAEVKKNETYGNIKFHWISEQGIFENWQQDTGKINVLGKDIKIDNQKIYWSVDSNSKINKTSFKIYLKVEDTDTSKEIYQTSIEIQQNKEGIFSIRR